MSGRLRLVVVVVTLVVSTQLVVFVSPRMRRHHIIHAGIVPKPQSEHVASSHIKSVEKRILVLKL